MINNMDNLGQFTTSESELNLVFTFNKHLVQIEHATGHMIFLMLSKLAEIPVRRFHLLYIVKRLLFNKLRKEIECVRNSCDY